MASSKKNTSASNSKTGGLIRKGADRRKNEGGAPPEGAVVDRRLGLDRRDVEEMRESLKGETTGAERHRGPGRRLSEFSKSAEEGEMNKEQFLFLMAIEAFKTSNNRTYPTWTDVLEVVRLLGYRKTAASELVLRNAEDWVEKADSPSNVRPPRWAERGGEKDSSGFGPDHAASEKELTDQALAEFEAQFGDDDFDELSEAA